MTWWTDFIKYLADGNNEKILCTLKKVSIKKTFDRSGNGLLHYVSKAEGDNESLAIYLTSAGCNVNATNYDGDAPLIEAIKLGNVRIVEHLVKAGADVDSVNKNDLTPLQQAFRCYSEERSQAGYEIIKTLVKAGSNIQVNGKDGEPLLIEAILCSFEEITALFIDSGALLDVRASIGRNHITPLHIAVILGKLDLAKRLIAAGADVNCPDFALQTCLHYAVCKPDLNMTLYLLHKGAWADCKDDQAYTPLTKAIFRNDAISAFLLIMAGADVNHIDNDGVTVLESAIVKFDFQMIKLLLHKGAIVNKINRNALFYSPTIIFFYTPLLLCILKCNVYNEEENFDGNVDPIENNEPFNEVEDNNQIMCVELLIEYGADVNYKFRSELTVIDIALLRCHSKIVGTLLNLGAVFDYNRYCVPKIFDECTNQNSIRELLRHTALHQAQNKSNKAWSFDKTKLLNEDHQKYFARCVEELELMKRSRVYGGVSFFQLIVNQNTYKYSRNEDLVQAMKDRSHAASFPIYWNLLDKRFSKELESEKLKAAASKSLGFIFGMKEQSFSLIFDCILQFLNEGDLCNLASVSCDLPESASFSRHCEFTRFLRKYESIYYNFNFDIVTNDSLVNVKNLC